MSGPTIQCRVPTEAKSPSCTHSTGPLYYSQSVADSPTDFFPFGIACGPCCKELNVMPGKVAVAAPVMMKAEKVAMPEAPPPVAPPVAPAPVEATLASPSPAPSKKGKRSQ